MILTFVLLGLAILAVWLPSFPFNQRQLPSWPLFFAAALVCGLMFGFLEPVAIAALAVFAACVFYAGDASTGWKRTIATVLTVILALALALHLVPGFRNPILIENVRFSPDAAPFKQFLNFDKAAVGLLLLAFLCRRCSTRAEWKEMFAHAWPIALATVSSVLLITCLVGYVRLEIKWTAYTPVFLATNLLFTCVAEEAFFRGVLQERLGQALAHLRHGALIAITVSGVLFGLVHMGGGTTLMLLSTLAGLGNAAAYARTRRIEAAILTHFALNALHFVFFTYPFLARG